MLPSFADWSAWLALAQNAAQDVAQEMAAPAAGAPGAPAGPAREPGLLEQLFNPIFLIPVMLLLFFFTVLRPQQLEQQKRKEEHDKMLADLKANDRVFTIGGIVGTVVAVNKEDKTVTLRIDEKSGARLTVLRSYIAGLESQAEDRESES
jgi:preprotein translocase subunit YajC